MDEGRPLNQTPSLSHKKLGKSESYMKLGNSELQLYERQAKHVVKEMKYV
jgi:hypothetical protein